MLEVQCFFSAQVDSIPPPPPTLFNYLQLNVQTVSTLPVEECSLQRQGRHKPRHSRAEMPDMEPILVISQALHGTAIYAYIDPPHHPNVSIYGSPMECLGLISAREIQLLR